MFNTVVPRYNEPLHNEDPVIKINIWKPGRITVNYVETSPAITNPRYKWLIDQTRLPLVKMVKLC